MLLFNQTRVEFEYFLLLLINSNYVNYPSKVKDRPLPSHYLFIHSGPFVAVTASSNSRSRETCPGHRHLFRICRQSQSDARDFQAAVIMMQALTSSRNGTGLPLLRKITVLSPFIIDDDVVTP